MPRVYIGVGSNVDPELNIPAALGFLKSKGRITGVSTFYRTSPVGPDGAPPFYNGVICLDTCFQPRELKFEVLRSIEDALGRVRCGDKCAPRPIDLDIALYGESTINEPDLIVPDPEIVARAFLAVPLLELDPDIVLPGTNARLADVVQSLDVGSMTTLDEFTQILRREIGCGPNESC